MKKSLIILCITIILAIPALGSEAQETFEFNATSYPECTVITENGGRLSMNGFTFKKPDPSACTFFGEAALDSGMTFDGWVDSSGSEICIFTSNAVGSDLNDEFLRDGMNSLSLAQLGKAQYGEKAINTEEQRGEADGREFVVYTWLMSDLSIYQDASFIQNNKVIEFVFLGVPGMAADSPIKKEYSNLIESIEFNAAAMLHYSTVDDFISITDPVIKSSYGAGNYGISYDNETVTINIWHAAIGQATDIIKQGDTSLVSKWQEMIDGTQTLANTETTELHGSFPDMHLRVNVLDDRDLSNVLLTFYDGELIYDITK